MKGDAGNRDGNEVAAYRPLPAPRGARALWAGCLLLAAGTTVSAAGQEAAGAGLPPLAGPLPESAASLLSLSIGDDEVDFFLQGRWRTTLSGTLAARFAPGTAPAFPVSIAALPATGLESIPELGFSIWLAERYFLETQLQGDFDSILLFGGYQGRAPEPLRHLYIGNVAFAAPRYPFIELPTVQDAIGINAELATERSQHRVIVRHERVRRAERLFQGNSLVEESRVALGDYVRGRFFYLPDAAEASVTLLAEQEGGPLDGSDGRSYRLLAADDASVDTDSGAITLTGVAPVSWTVHHLEGRAGGGRRGSANRQPPQPRQRPGCIAVGGGGRRERNAHVKCRPVKELLPSAPASWISRLAGYILATGDPGIGARSRALRRPPPSLEGSC